MAYIVSFFFLKTIYNSGSSFQLTFGECRHIEVSALQVTLKVLINQIFVQVNTALFIILCSAVVYVLPSSFVVPLGGVDKCSVWFVPLLPLVQC